MTLSSTAAFHSLLTARSERMSVSVSMHAAICIISSSGRSARGLQGYKNISAGAGRFDLHVWVLHSKVSHSIFGGETLESPMEELKDPGWKSLTFAL